MSRSNSPLLLALTLTIGVGLGVVLDRGRPFVAAQVPVPSTRQEASGASSGSGASALAGVDGATKASSEEELYRHLDRQYEQFRQVNQTFELVARAISPSVVHIVAQKTSRGEESPRVR